MKKIAIEKLCIKSQERKQFWTNILSVEKKDKNSRPVINLKKRKEKKVHPIQPFPNKKSTFSKRFLEDAQLYVQFRPQGCIFLHSSIRGIKETNEVLLAKQTISVPFLLVWSGINTLHFYHILESASSFSLSIRYCYHMII